MNWENRRKHNIGDLLVVLITVMGLSILSKNLFNLYTNYSLYIMFACSLMIIFTSRSILRDFFLFCLVFFVYLIVSITYNGGGFGSIITILLFLLTLLSYTYFNLTERTCKFLVWFSLLMIVFLFSQSFIYSEDFYYHRYNSINQNTMSMYVIYFFMLLFTVSDLNNKIKKTGIIGLFIIALIALNNYSARGCTMALFFYMVLNFVFRKKWSNKIILLISVVVIILGIAIPFVYLSLFKNNIDIVIFGKSLYTGRESIWNNMFIALNQNKINWLFGLGSKAILWTGHTLNVHNDFFAVLVNFGLIGFVLYYGFLLSVIVKISKIAQHDAYAKKALFMYISGVLMLGWFEVTTLWTTILPLTCFGLGIGYRLCKIDIIRNGV